MNNIFEQLAANSSRNFKIDFLTQNKDNDTLKRVIFLALDPFTQFYIRKIPSYSQTYKMTFGLEWALDELQKFSKRELTGNAAIEHLKYILSSVNEDDAKVIERIISKDLKCGVSEATVNAVWPGLIPEYPCMLASAYDQKLVDKVKFPAYIQLKLDGMRFNAIVKNGTVQFRSRNGKEIDIADPLFALPFIHLAAFYKSDVVFDGELLVVDSAGKTLDRKTGNGILNKAVKGTQSKQEGSMVRATVWDAIPLDAFEQGIYKVSYDDRAQKLHAAINDLNSSSSGIAFLVSMAPTYPVNGVYEVQKYFEKFLALGQEGIILKTKEMIWENKRSKHQIKFKGEMECDLKVVDWVEGTGKNVGRMGALVVESADGFVKVGLGTGFSDADRMAITRADVGRIVAVKYNARITDKRTGLDSLFLPVFVEFRDDKNVADKSKDIK